MFLVLCVENTAILVELSAGESHPAVSFRGLAYEAAEIAWTSFWEVSVVGTELLKSLKPRTDGRPTFLPPSGLYESEHVQRW